MCKSICKLLFIIFIPLAVIALLHHMKCGCLCDKKDGKKKKKHCCF